MRKPIIKLVALGMVISLFVLPRLTGLFRSFDFELHLTTRILLAFSRFMADYGIVTVIGLLILIPLVIYAFRSKAIRPFTHALLLRTPIVGGVIQRVNLGRFTMILGSLLQNGVPINKAMPITHEVLSNESYRKALEKAGKRIDTGEPLSITLAAHTAIFPPFVIQMIGAGEQSGRMEDMLFYLADFYEQELDATLKNLSVIIEPILLISIGLLVAFTAFAIITPVYNLIGSIGI